MSRYIKLFIICALALCAGLTACGRDTGGSAADTAAELALLYPEQSSSCTFFFDGAAEYEPGYLSDAELRYLYCSESEGLASADEAIALTECWAVLLSPGTELFEVHVFRARNIADADVIAKLLYRRVKLLRSYEFMNVTGDYPGLTGSRGLFGGYEYGSSPLYGSSAEIAAGSFVYVTGRLVILLATPDNASAVKLIDPKAAGYSLP